MRESTIRTPFLILLLMIHVRKLTKVNAIFLLLQALQEEKLASDARFLAGLLFKNTILNSTKVRSIHHQNPKLENLFNSLKDQEKEDLKYGCLSALGFEDAQT